MSVNIWQIRQQSGHPIKIQNKSAHLLLRGYDWARHWPATPDLDWPDVWLWVDCISETQTCINSLKLSTGQFELVVNCWVIRFRASQLERAVHQLTEASALDCFSSLKMSSEFVLVLHRVVSLEYFTFFYKCFPWGNTFWSWPSA